MSAACDRDGIAKGDGGLILPVVLRPAPVGKISAIIGLPHVGKVLEAAPTGIDKVFNSDVI